MKRSFERKPVSLETEADSYEVEMRFSLKQLLNGIESAKKYGGEACLCYLISKEKRLVYLGIGGHLNIGAGRDIDETFSGGSVTVSDNALDKKFVVKDIDGDVGSSAAYTPEKDFPLIRRIIQKCLDNIKK